MTPDQLPFPAIWYAPDLADYRPCDGTYCPYPYDSLPPITVTLYGDFAWLDFLPENPYDSADPLFVAADMDQMTTEAAEMGFTLPDDMEKFQSELNDPIHPVSDLSHLISLARELGLTLPPEFIEFMSRRDRQLKIPSCTACWFTLPDRIVKHPAADGYVIRFLNDQQDVLFWYLYLTPQGNQAVLCSWIPFDYDNVLDGDFAPTAADPQNTYYAAPDFESFIYRFWMENDLWFRLNDGRPLAPQQQAYVDAYAKKKS